MTTVSRREFVSVLTAAGGSLLLGYRVGEGQRVASVASAPGFAPNAFIRIAPDGSITLFMPQAEMGQGTHTSMSMLLAEELEVTPEQVRLEHAPPDDKLYANPLFGEQITGASSSIRMFYEPLRRAGATARAMLIAAAAASWNVDAASCRAREGVVTHTPTGRTLSYGALAAKAATVPVPDKIALKDPKDFTLIGTPAKRPDTPSKVNGTAQYGIDVRLPGMLIATVAASPVLGGKVAGLDDEKAKAVPGVRQIVQLDDAVAVVADHMWAAKQGSAALEIRWEDGPNAKVSTADVVEGLAKASETAGVTARKDGDPASALAGAAKKVEAVYESPFLAHATMEPMNCTVHVRRDGCEVWTGSQVLSRARAAAAKVTGLPLEKVVVHNHFLGGGFGRRLEVDYVTQAVRIAKQVDAPVKVVWTREEDVQHDVYRPYYYDRFAAGLDAHGKPVAWSHRIVGPSIMARFLPPGFKDGIDIDAVDGAVQLLYDIPAIQIEYVRHEEPVLNTGFWRGVGVTHNNFVVESFIDELAAVSKQDPVAFRRALLRKSPRALTVLELAAKEAGWGKPVPRGRGRGVALLFSSWGTYLAQVAEVEVTGSSDVRVRRIVCAVDCGQVVNPDIVKAQIESGVVYGISGALWGEVTLNNGRVEQSNFNNYRVLRMNETPPIDVRLVRNSEAPGGIGEPGTSVTAAALANAVYAATGKRLRKLPLQPGLASSTR
ncbi:MAG TPA: xanthine dehydrogenase family protein molybdopterin-binding subunit [Steroidobacteraceae bacterium]|nr:xanthine dehydrogenase family protein molybdopterin-binding subunit [Steroidobacteraceae bacterium]